MTSGKEGVVRTWSVPSLEQQWEMPLKDGVGYALHCRHPALAHDAMWLWRPKEEEHVVVSCIRGQAMENRLNDIVRVSQRGGRTSRIVQLAVHPLQPHLLCMLTTAGLVVYEVGTRWAPSVAVVAKEVQRPAAESTNLLGYQPPVSHHSPCPLAPHTHLVSQTRWNVELTACRASSVPQYPRLLRGRGRATYHCLYEMPAPTRQTLSVPPPVITEHLEAGVFQVTLPPLPCLRARPARCSAVLQAVHVCRRYCG